MANLKNIERLEKSVDELDKRSIDMFSANLAETKAGMHIFLLWRRDIKPDDEKYKAYRKQIDSVFFDTSLLSSVENPDEYTIVVRKLFYYLYINKIDYQQAVTMAWDDVESEMQDRDVKSYAKETDIIAAICILECIKGIEELVKKGVREGNLTMGLATTVAMLYGMMESAKMTLNIRKVKSKTISISQGNNRKTAKEKARKTIKTKAEELLKDDPDRYIWTTPTKSGEIHFKNLAKRIKRDTGLRLTWETIRDHLIAIFPTKMPPK